MRYLLLIAMLAVGGSTRADEFTWGEPSPEPVAEPINIDDSPHGYWPDRPSPPPVVEYIAPKVELPPVVKVKPQKWHPYRQPDFQQKMDGLSQQERMRSLGRIRRQTSSLQLIAPRYVSAAPRYASTPAFRAGSC